MLDTELREEPLHLIWKYSLFRMPLVDLDDLPVELVDPGQHNLDSGPDFLNARIRSEGILWAGNVEIHRRASQWYQHGHHLDPAFDNVILHVVLDPDCQVRNSRGREVRTAAMEVPSEVLRQYGLLVHHPELVPDTRYIRAVEAGRMLPALEKLLHERLTGRAARIRAELKYCGGDWAEVFYTALARAFGQKVNADPFEMLARSVSLESILASCPDLLSKEAVLYGQAGMLGDWMSRAGRAGGGQGSGAGERQPAGNLPGSEDPYLSELRERYASIRERLGLVPMTGFLWKFLRLRPDNFPTIRISQLAASLERYPGLFRQLRDHPDPLDLVLKLEIGASEYWETHYRFRRESPPREKSPGRDRLAGLFINAVLPVLYAENMIRGDARRADELRGMLARVPPENNRTIRMWKSLGIAVPDGFTSQALLQLSDRGGFIR